MCDFKNNFRFLFSSNKNTMFINILCSSQFAVNFVKSVISPCAPLCPAADHRRGYSSELPSERKSWLLEKWLIENYAR